MSIQAIQVQELPGFLTDQKRSTLDEYGKALERLNLVVERIKRHLDESVNQDPCWVLNQDLVSAKENLLFAEYGFQKAWGFIPQLELAS